MADFTHDNVFDGVALEAYGDRDRYVVVVEGIAKMRECAPADVYKRVEEHIKALKAIVLPLAAHGAAIKALGVGELDAEQQAALEKLQAPFRTEFLNYCAEKLVLHGTKAQNFLERFENYVSPR